MTIVKRFALTLNALCFLLSLSGVTFAQEQRPAPKPQPANVPITVAASGQSVRFTALGAVERMRLEVFDASGVTVFDSGFRPGNMRDWQLRGTHGEQLSDSTYLCVVTIKELSGRLSLKQGNVLVENGQASQTLDGAGQSGAIEPEQALSTRTAQEPASMTIVAHDGTTGQVTSTTGPLTFRTGDVFTGKEIERMRLTEDGKLGIGTKNPQAALDVAGVIRARKGISFPDGTVQTTGTSGRVDSQGNVTPNATGTGTAGQLAKWADNAGTLGDSIVTELTGKIGIGTATPNNKLHVVGAIEIGAASGTGINPTLTNPNNVANFSQLTFYPASGTNVNASFAVVPRGTGVASNLAQFSVFNTDFIANSTNYEFASLRARGTDFVFGTGKNGTGVNRPLMFAAGFLSNNSTNNGQLFLSTNGNVGIGNTNPLRTLQIGPSINAAFTLEQGTTPNAGYIRFGDKTGWKLHIGRNRETSVGPLNTGTNGVLMTIQDNGRVGIGTTTPSATLQVNGHIDTNTMSVFDGFIVVLDGQEEQSNPVCISNANYRMGYCSSSLRYKTDVTRFIGGLDIIDRLRPVSFNWKRDGKHDIGLAAEEVEQVEPLLTFRNGKGEIEGVRYNQLSAVFINAFKEQQAQLQRQQKLIERLQSRLTRLERVNRKRQAGARRIR